MDLDPKNVSVSRISFNAIKVSIKSAKQKPTYTIWEPPNGSSRADKILRQHRTEKCVQKMQSSDKIRTWINK